MHKDPIIYTQLRENPLTFVTTWGLFSPKEIDEGSKLLIDLVKLTEDADILDLGCGYGPIGIALAKDAPSGETHMLDKDFVAVDYANKNAEANHAPNAKAYLSNGFSAVPKNMEFDVIVSNIPAKVGKELLQIIMQDAHTHLKPGGSFYVVTIAGLREFMKRHFKETFGNYKKLKQSKGYAVAVAEKSLLE